MQTVDDPHKHQPVYSAGPAPADARAVLILVHGRGASAQSMLPLYEQFELPTVAALAPQAANSTWYPQSFLAPLEANQPNLDSALERLQTIVEDLLAMGISSSRIALLGFSQGACLTAEFVVRHPRQYGAIMALTGGVIGPPGTPRRYSGSLDGSPAFLGTSDPDPHVPFERVKETERVLAQMGAAVELRRYPGMPHTINEDEFNACRTLIESLVSTEGEMRS